LKANRSFGGKYRLHLQGRKISQQETSVKADVKLSTLKVEAICSTETTDYTVLYPKDSTLHNHRCENLKSYTSYTDIFRGFPQFLRGTQ
jgi:hypothetical protein